MHRIVKSPLAEIDLLDIWEYSYHKWGADQADTYLSQLDAAMHALLKNPQIGKSCASIRSGF